MNDIISTPQKALENFKKRFQTARGIADQWEGLLQQSFRYAIPFRDRFYETKQNQGELKNSRVYDTTAVEATKSFVSKLHAAMTPPQTQWGFLDLDGELVDADAAEKEEAQNDLDVYMRRLFKFIHASNFDVVINECYFDLAVGTSCLVINGHTDKQPLLFTSIPIDKLAIEEALNGKIETWFRTWHDIKISEINTRWKKAVPTPSMLHEVSEDLEARVKKLHEGVLYYPHLDKPYIYAVWTNDAILFAEELESNPGIVWRFQKTNNDVWGRGPVMEALPSIISLNEMARIELASANLNTFKPYMAFSDGVFNPHTFQLQPMTVIPIAPTGTSGQLPLVPLPDSSSPQFAQLTINDLRAQISALLFAESPEGTGGVQPQTATEVSLKQQTLSQKIGPLFSRLQHEFLEPLINRCSFILDKAGILPRPQVDGRVIQFKYKSPLALSTGQQDVAAFAQWVQVIQGVWGPEVTQMFINPQTTPFLIAEKMQIDPEMLNSPEQVKQMAEQAAQIQAQQAQAEQEQQGDEPAQ